LFSELFKQLLVALAHVARERALATPKKREIPSRDHHDGPKTRNIFTQVYLGGGG
jgi:hypothetical protein